MPFIGNPKIGDTAEDHACVYIGSLIAPEELFIGKEAHGSFATLSNANQSLEEFFAANKKGVFADPLLNCAGMTKKELAPLYDYCKQFNLTHVISVRSFEKTPLLVANAPKIMKNATEVAASLQQMLKPFAHILGKEKNSMSHEEFKSEAKKAFTSNQNNQSILASLQTSVNNNNASQFQTDQISAQALLAIKSNSNPHQLYKDAVQAYKEKKYEVSTKLLTQALSLYESTKKIDIEACCKCHSTLISNYRDQKMYDAGIQSAERAITLYAAEADISSISSIVKKFHECLKLRCAASAQMYDQAVQHYKDKQYHLAIFKIDFVISAYDLSSEQSKLATCHSTLASCYREIGNVEKAIYHCEEAIKLRQAFLKPTDQLVTDLEKKLEKLLLTQKEVKNVPISFSNKK